MNVRYRVELSQSERAELMQLMSGGKRRRASSSEPDPAGCERRVSDEDIAASVGVGGSTVYRTKRRFVEGNLERALSEEPRPGAERKLTGKEEALLVATACSSPPAGRARWTLELLAGEMVKLIAHESVSRETVRRRLAENHLKPWRKDMWCIPQVDADYVARMEDVLDVGAARRFNPPLRASLQERLSKLEASVLPSRPLKVVTVRRRYDEDPDAALDRHFAAHPEDQDANVVIFHFLR